MKLELQYMGESAAYLLLAVNLAARVMPGSLLIWMVGESVLPVLRELECREKTLGWSSLKRLDNNVLVFRKKEKLAHPYMTEASLTDDQDKYDDHNVLYMKSHVMQVKMYL